MLVIDDGDRVTLQKLLSFALPGKEIIAFGSRVYGQPRARADFDIAVKGASDAELQQLRDYLSVSPLSILVDVSNYDRLDDWLRQTIDAKGERVQ